MIVHAAGDRAAENVQALRIDLSAIQRLTRRATALDGPGALDFFQRRALILTAIEVARCEGLRTREILIGLQSFGSGYASDGSLSRRLVIEATSSQIAQLDEYMKRLDRLEQELRFIDAELDRANAATASFMKAPEIGPSSPHSIRRRDA